MAELVFIDAQRGVGQQAAPATGPSEAEALDAYSQAVISVAERLTPSVANLRVSRRVRGGRVLDGGGSGVVITPDGFLLTSAHVVARSDSRGRASFADGQDLEVDVVGADPLSDLAVLRASGADLVPAELGNADSALGSSWSRSGTRTGSRARSRQASCPRSGARCRPAPAPPCASSTT